MRSIIAPFALLLGVGGLFWSLGSGSFGKNQYKLGMCRGPAVAVSDVSPHASVDEALRIDEQLIKIIVLDVSGSMDLYRQELSAGLARLAGQLPETYSSGGPIVHVIYTGNGGGSSAVLCD